MQLETTAKNHAMIRIWILFWWHVELYLILLHSVLEICDEAEFLHIRRVEIQMESHELCTCYGSSRLDLPFDLA